MARKVVSPDDVKLRLAKNVRARRLRNGYTQLDLAAEAGVAAGTIYWLERSGRSSTDTLTKVAKVLGCSVATLFG